MTIRILYQFPISHYCEKIRWQLEHKGLDYRPRNLLPGPHRLRTQWLARINTLPILLDGERVVGDSTKIAYYLEKYYPEHSLVPEDPDARGRVIELEQQFDRIAVHVRRWLYGQVLKRPETIDAVLDPYRLPGPIKRAMIPITREGMRRLYAIRPKAVVYSEQRVEEGLALVEEALAQGTGDYLVDNHLSLADIGAASLLAPLIGPPGTPWDIFDESTLPPSLQKKLTDMRERPAGQWILERYRIDRWRANKPGGVRRGSR